jgi:outer membrane protein assembly factor BamB
MAMKLGRVAKAVMFLTLAFILMAMPAQAAGPEENLATSHDWTKFAYDLANTSYTPDPGPRVLSVRWRFPLEPYSLPFEIWTRPAVVDNIVYVTATPHVVVTDDPWIRPYRDFENSVFALNAENGDVIWHRQLGTFSNSSPTVVDGVVLVASNEGNVYALDAENGEVIWNKDLLPGQMSSPAVAYGKVFVATYDGHMYALNAENGDIIWVNKLGAAMDINASPAIENNEVFIASGNSLFSLDAENGDVTWFYSIENNEIDTSPSVAYGKVYISSNVGDVYAFHVENGSLAWEYIVRDGLRDSLYEVPAVGNGMVYAFKNTLEENRILAINAYTGVVVWEGPLSSSMLISVIIADNVVFAGWHGDGLWMLDAFTGNTLQKVGHDIIDGISAVGDRLYITSHDRFVAALGAPDNEATTEPPQTSPVLWLAIFGVAGAVVIGFLFLMFRARLLTARGIRRR